jgi:hypothetical protein
VTLVEGKEAGRTVTIREDHIGRVRDSDVVGVI